MKLFETNNNRLVVLPINIVLVDDNIHTSKLNATLLKMNKEIGWVHSFSYTEKALEFLSGIGNKENTLVVSDIFMPISTGFELAKELEDKNWGIPVVLLSASTDIEEYKKKNKIGLILDVLPKPLSKKRVADILVRYKKWCSLS